MYGSAAFIVLPQTFSIAYISYAITHMLIRIVRRKPDLDQRFEDYLDRKRT